MAFLPRDALERLGFRALGQNVLISDRASIYSAERISIASNVRIDDFTVVSAGIEGISVGSHVHISVGCFIVGAAKITLGDFSGLASRGSIFSSTDDFSGEYLTGPTIPEEFRRVDSRPVHVERHVIVGAGAVILPGVTIGEGAAIGALSLVTKNVPELEIYGGVPAKRLGPRLSTIFDLEKRLLHGEA